MHIFVLLSQFIVQCAYYQCLHSYVSSSLGVCLCVLHKTCIKYSHHSIFYDYFRALFHKCDAFRMWNTADGQDIDETVQQLQQKMNKQPRVELDHLRYSTVLQHSKYNSWLMNSSSDNDSGSSTQKIHRSMFIASQFRASRLYSTTHFAPPIFIAFPFSFDFHPVLWIL